MTRAPCLASCPARAFLQGKQQGKIRFAIPRHHLESVPDRQRNRETSEMGPGCVKTRRRSIAIEQVTRSRPFHVPTSEAHSILKSKSRISFSSRFELLSFHTAWVICDQFSLFCLPDNVRFAPKADLRWRRQKTTASYNDSCPLPSCRALLA